MLSFSERMQEARDTAARKRGQSIGRASYPARPLPERDSWDYLVLQVRTGLRSDFRNILNDFRVSCLNGTPFGVGFEHDDNGKPYIETVPHREGNTRYHPIADREAGAKRRLTRILKNYPTLSAYIQTDPRGCALYIMRPGDVREGEAIDACYSRGVAVYK